jgi:hypothetical protein
MNIDVKETVCGNVDCIFLPQHRDQWRALVITVMNLRVPQRPRIS